MNFQESATRYWLMACRDAMRLNFSPRKLASRGTGSWHPSRGSLFESCVGDTLGREVFEFIKAEEQEHEIPVMVCPTPCRIIRAHASAALSSLPGLITPIWLPGILDRSGKLQPVKGQFPWIPRNFLTPCDAPADALVGDLDLLDRFLTGSPPPDEWESWGAQWEYAVEMYRAVTGLSFGQSHSSYYEAGPDGVLVVESAVTGASFRITSVYEDMLETASYPALFRALSDPVPLQGEKALSQEELFLADGNHVGQMGSAYSLAESQREALCHLGRLPDGELLAVNGPPGTGKTTLVQSVVADMVVKAALAGEEPPLIFATSTNNQAVTNVIDAMGKADEEPGPLAGRWLPRINSYGLYCASESKFQQAVKEGLFQVENPKFNGFFAELETVDYLNEALPFFLEQFNGCFTGTVTDISSACRGLHDELLKVAGAVSARPELLLDAHAFRARRGDLLAQKEKLVARQRQLQAAIGKAREDERTILGYIARFRARMAAEPWYFRWFCFIPWIGAARAAEIREFADSTGLPQLSGCGQPQSILAELDLLLQTARETLRGVETESAEVSREIDALDAELNAGDQLEAQLASWHETWGLDPEAGDCADVLDRSLRHRAFKLAVHYWEARWILELADDLADAYQDKKSPGKLQRRLRHFAKITPCFVATLYTLPAFVTTYLGVNKPLYSYIDLLVVDEAGQVSPEVAGAAFALARRALVIGDTLQIEPVWNIPEIIDSANCRRYLDIDYDQATDCGIAASNGSVMKLAQGRSFFSCLAEPRGLMLVEHRRCLPEIIAYCNQLAYHGRLKPLRSDRPAAGFHLPPMGWAHCHGTMNLESGSRSNPAEATIIARWVADHHDEFLTWYNARKKDDKSPLAIGDLVGIVTPFRSQSLRIQRELEKLGLAGITVGTVHALQGAERPIVIFSPVYDIRHRGDYFFDASLSMLNVAVSRAKDSFLVFGDIDIFDTALTERPSGLLARHLFGDPAAEITDIIIPEREPLESATLPEVSRLASLEDHRAFLKHALETAREKILIVSPWITAEAVSADDVPGLVRGAADRGVAVTIVTDYQCNRTSAGFKDGFAEACALLTAAGAAVHLTHNIHNKTLCVDRHCLAEGSFNWLSAVRARTHRYQRAEMSIAYSGEAAAGFIDDAFMNMEARRRYPSPVC